MLLWRIFIHRLDGLPPMTSYLNNTIDSTPYQDLHDDQHMSTMTKKANSIDLRKIVILPGPHKTGSTSIQAALHHWFHNDNNNTSTILLSPGTRRWAYPVPTPEELVDIGISSHEAWEDGRKGFSPMVTRLFVNPEKNIEEVIEQSPLLQLYKRKIQEAWEKGYNIVIASEHLDRLARSTILREDVSTKRTSWWDHEKASPVRRGPSPGRPILTSEDFWERFLSLLPTTTTTTKSSRTTMMTTNDDYHLIIGVTYRTPRIEHLLSLWHHVGQDEESLGEFITKRKPPGLTFTQHSLDVLGLAHFFVKYHDKDHDHDGGGRYTSTVRILDSGHLEEDLPIAVACHIMDIPEFCLPFSSSSTMRSSLLLTPRYNVRSTTTTTERLPSNSTTTSITAAAHHHHQQDTKKKTLDNQTLQDIDTLLFQHDCQYQTIQVQWVNHDHDGRPKIFDHCPPRLRSSSSWWGGRDEKKDHHHHSPKTKIKAFSETIEAIINTICRTYPTTKHCV